MNIEQYEPAQLPAPPFITYAPWVGPTDISTMLGFMIPIVVLMGVLGMVFIGIRGIARK